MAGGGPGAASTGIWAGWVAVEISEKATALPEKATLPPDDSPLPRLCDQAAPLCALASNSLSTLPKDEGADALECLDFLL